MMLAQLFILFALASVAASAKNLREAPAVNAVFLDHQRAATVLKSMVKQRVTAQKSDASFIRERVQSGTAKGKLQVEANAKAAADAKFNTVATMSSNNVRFVNDGYYVTRHRPNSDCSGVPTMVYAQRLNGECHLNYFGFDSYREGCSQEGDDGPVSMVTTFYSNRDCSGAPYYSYSYSAQDECAFNTYATSYGFPPIMQSVQCTGKADPALHSGGLVFYSYDYTNQCQSAPTSYSVQKFGACQLVYEYDNDYGEMNLNTHYTYVTMDECSADGKITVTGYTDGACTRPQWRGTINMAHEVTDFNGCVWDYNYSQYTRTVCLAAEA